MTDARNHGASRGAGAHVQTRPAHIVSISEVGFYMAPRNWSLLLVFIIFEVNRRLGSETIKYISRRAELSNLFGTYKVRALR